MSFILYYTCLIFTFQYWNHRKVYFAHDENNECRDGDTVVIKECMPISKKKSFRVSEIIEKAQILQVSPKITEEQQT